MKVLNAKSLISTALLSVVAVLMNSCNVSQGTFLDDIYADDTEISAYEQELARQQAENIYKNTQRQSVTRQYREPLSSANQVDTLANDSLSQGDYADFDMDDYYDYAYAARLKRFHRPVIVYDYYDDFYTDLCWYDSDPMYWGSSIYLGYRWWYPSWNYYYSWGWGWHSWHYNPWHYNPWYWDYYAWGGYYHPYHHHHHPWYYNTRDRNSNFYRPNYGEGSIARGNATNSRPGYRGEPSQTSNGKSFGEKYIQRYGNQQTASTTRPSVTRQNPAKQGTSAQKPNRRTSSVQPSQRTYTPASVRQQRNNNEYRNNQRSNHHQSDVRSTSNNRHSGNVNRSINNNRSNSSINRSSSRGSSSHSGGSSSRGSSSHSGGSSSSHGGGHRR